MNDKTEYLAFILIGAGSTWGRDTDKEKAIASALDQLRGWDQYFDVYDREVRVNVIDVTGFDDLIWDYEGVHGAIPGGHTDGYQKIDRPIERITRRSPPKRKPTAKQKRGAKYHSTSLRDFGA